MSKVDIELIRVGTRLRGISEAQVEALVNSIADVGLLNPITVYPRSVVAGGIAAPGYGLVAGAHRLEACKRLGLAEIDAHVVELSELERQIAECDENLCSSALTPSEKALFTARRKEAYEALHPETKHGTNQHSSSRQLGDSPDRFTADTAAKTGESERTIQRNAERGERIEERALALVRGTRLDNGTYLDKLKQVEPNKQAAKVKADLEASKPIKVGAAAPSPEEAFLKWEGRMNKLFGSAPLEWRQRWLESNDSPVFDRTRAA